MSISIKKEKLINKALIKRQKLPLLVYNLFSNKLTWLINYCSKQIVKGECVEDADNLWKPAAMWSNSI